MKILLINPPFDYPSHDLLVREPLSLAYLASYVRRCGYEVRILDGVAGEVSRKKTGWHYGLSNAEIGRYIRRYKPNIVGVTCPFSLRIASTIKIVDLVKKIDRKIVTVVGGIHPTIFPSETVKHKNVDFVIIGEGEESFKKLLDYLRSSHKQHSPMIDGLAYKVRTKIKIIPKTQFIENLDSLPLPARDLLPMDYYLKRKTIIYGLGEKKTACLITSRSCPKGCTFCSMYLSHGRKWRSRSAEYVIEEIRMLLTKYGVQEIFIMDDNLTLNKERMMKICQMIIKEKLRFHWNTPNGVAAIFLDDKLLRLMKKAGCSNICIGVESGNDFIRNQVIKKGLLRSTIAAVLNECRLVGLPIVGFFILGIPGENDDTFRDTLKMVREMPFSMIAVSFYTPFPGTELYNECIRNKYIKPGYWKKLNHFHRPIVETPSFDRKKLQKWEKQIYFEFIRGHFVSLALSTLSFHNPYFKWNQIERFLHQRFLLHSWT
jgi:anaerobic magnesium-protoporphyrin IX monomethyl ester cyclase